jgi:hypothetical protein
MELVRGVLKDCYFHFNDISSSIDKKLDIEVSFSKVIVCFRHTYRYDTFKIHIEFVGCAEASHALCIADFIAKMECVVDTPHVHVDTWGCPQYIDVIVTKATMYNIAKLLLLFTRFPVLENHEENIL